MILVGGSSHVGKTTLAESLATRLGWTCMSTDSLARHPGRPWQQKPDRVPDRVAKHYLSLSVDELVEDVLRHYRVNVRPLVEAAIHSHAADPSSDRLIVEGSALWPESVASLDLGSIVALWLTADDGLFERRIYGASQYATRVPRGREMIDKFLKRTLRYNEQMMDVVTRLGLTSMSVKEGTTVDELTERCLSLPGMARR